MTKLIHLFRKIDFLGPEIKFRINKEENYKTYLGAVFSLIAYCLYIIFFIIFGLDLVQKQNPNVLINQLTSDGTENFTITNTTFVAFRIDDFKGNEFDFSNLFSIKLSWELYDNNKDVTKDNKVFSYQRCSDPKFLDFFAIDQIFDPNDYYCFDTGQIADKNLFGTDDTDTLSYLLFQMDICDLNTNATTKVNCNDYKKAREIISTKNLFLNILYNEIIFSPSNFTTPFTQAIKKYRNSLHMNLHKLDNFYFNKNTLTQDNNFILPDSQDLVNVYSINRIENFVNFRTDDELSSIYNNSTNQKTESSTLNNLQTIYFKYETNYKTYSRTYLKIPDVLATLNGFMDLIVWILGFVNVYTTTQLSYSFFNRCVKLKLNDFSQASSQIQSRINTVKFIEMGEARVFIKGLHQQNVNDSKHENYFNHENFDLNVKENFKNAENNNEKIENEDIINIENIGFKNNNNNPFRNNKISIEENEEKEEKKKGEKEEEFHLKGNAIWPSNQPETKVLHLKNSEKEKIIVNNNEFEDRKSQDIANKNDLNSNKKFPSKFSNLLE